METIIFTIAINAQSGAVTFNTNMQAGHAQAMLDAMHMAQKAVVDAALKTLVAPHPPASETP